MPKLYELAEDVAVVETWLEEATDEVIAGGGEVPAHIAALLDPADAAFERKVDGVVRAIRNFEATAEMLKEEKLRLGKLQSAAENRAKWLRRYLARCLALAKRLSLKVLTATISVRPKPVEFRLAPTLTPESVAKAGGPLSLFIHVETIPEYVVPAETRYSLNETAIAAAIAAGALDPEQLPAGLYSVADATLTIR